MVLKQRYRLTNQHSSTSTTGSRASNVFSSRVLTNSPTSPSPASSQSAQTDQMPNSNQQPPQPDASLRTITTLLQKNQVILQGQIGTGTHSRVFRALTTTPGHDIAAVKLIDLRNKGEYIDRFMERELKIVTELNHPNIVKVFQIHRTRDYVAILEEFAPHGDLLHFIRTKEQKHLDEKTAKFFFRQLIGALMYLESKLILHRDLKCENIFLDSSYNVKLGDFGFTRMLRPGEHSNTHCGSKPYAALELLSGLPYHGNAVDIWSAGVVLYVMLTGCFPYGGAQDEVDTIIKRQRLKSIKFPSRLSKDVINLILRMLEPKVAHRATTKEIVSHPWLATT